MISFTNPYNEAKAELLREYKGEIPLDKQKEYEELERKSREFTEEKINSLKQTIERINESSKDTPKKYPKLTRQYKELVRLHREAKEITKDIGAMKKSVIDEMQRKRRTKNESSFNKN